MFYTHRNRPCLFTRFFGHLKTILVHKYWVFICCCKVGMPIRGFFHDFSKFSPTEFFEGVKYYRDNTSPINYAKKNKGYSAAWFHHRGHNKHHYESWMDNFDQGGEKSIYERELTWWTNRQKQPLAMHPGLQNFVTECLTEMRRTNRFITKAKACEIYHRKTARYK